MATCRTQDIDKNLFSPQNIRECERYVFAIQQRLDRAVATNNVKRIRHILDLLTKRSQAVKILAVYRIAKRNQGKHTAGTDGISIPKDDRQASEKMMIELLKSINIKSKPEKVKRVYIPKANGKKHPLGIPTLKDRINQEILRIALDPISEYYAHDNSFGFRPKRSCQDAINAIFIKFAPSNRQRYIVEGDIKGCFDNISHEHILETLQKWNVSSGIIGIISDMLKAKVFFKGEVYDSDNGTPQGGVISPMLANVALTALDNYVSEKYGKTYWDCKTSPMIRYADDFIISAKSKSDAKAIKADIRDFLNDEIGLTLSDEKTKITHIYKGFNFLGFNVRKYKKGHKQSSNPKDYKLLIKPRKEKINNMLKACSEVLSKNKTAPQVSIINQLNPKINGWGNYYKFVVSSKIFNSMDKAIWYKLLNWGKRRHTNKGVGWVVRRYFYGSGNRFSEKQNKKNYTIAKLSEIFSSQRFIKVRQGMRVFNREHNEYWEKRERLNAYDRLFSKKSRRLFDYQQGKCPLCKTQIKESDIVQGETHIHHLVPLSKGGSDRYSNLCLIHEHCHEELHKRFTLNQMYNIAEKYRLNYVNAFDEIMTKPSKEIIKVLNAG